MSMRRDEAGQLGRGGSASGQNAVPSLIATIFSEPGSTGVHTHLHQLCAYLRQRGAAPEIDAEVVVPRLHASAMIGGQSRGYWLRPAPG